MNTQISGIYAIRNKIDGKLYIGSSKSVHHRWKDNHLPMLRAGTHFNKHLQNAWRKHGEESFGFDVLEKCPEEQLLFREGHWIEKKKTWDRNRGYNYTRIIDGKNVFSKETRDLMSKSSCLGQEFWSTGINADIVSLFQEGFAKNAIAKQLGVCRSAVYSCLEFHGLHKRSGGIKTKLTPEVKQQVVDLRDKNTSVEDICEQVGVSRTQLYRALGLKDGKYGGTKVNRKSYRTLTPEVRERAVQMRGEGKTWKAIGEELGVSRLVFYYNGLAKEQGEMVRKKITPDIVAQAKAMREEGCPWKDITSRFGCSAQAIRKHL
jgi:transposase-like protein